LSASLNPGANPTIVERFASTLAETLQRRNADREGLRFGHEMDKLYAVSEGVIQLRPDDSNT
jgi:hypothetical protein